MFHPYTTMLVIGFLLVVLIEVLMPASHQQRWWTRRGQSSVGQAGRPAAQMLITTLVALALAICALSLPAVVIAAAGGLI